MTDIQIPGDLTDTQAERVTLGIMLLYPARFDPKTTKADLFFQADHRVLYDAILGAYTDGEKIEPLLIARRMGTATATQIVQGAVQTVDDDGALDTYLKRLGDLAWRRKNYIAGQRLASASLSDTNETEITAARAEIDNTGGNDGTRTLAEINVSLLEVMEQRADAGDNLIGPSTGFAELDSWTLGWRKPSLNYVAARPAVGKTSFLCGQVIHALAQGKRVDLYSLELTPEEILTKIYSSCSGIAHRQIELGRLTNRQWQTVINAMKKIKDSDLYIYDISDEPNVTVDDMYVISKPRNPDLVYIDYFQYIDWTNESGHNKAAQMGQVSRKLKKLSNRLDAAIICAAQLGRVTAEQKSRRPSLHHISDTGATEKDAYTVMLLHREGAYEPGQHQDVEPMEIILEKNRYGRTGVQEADFVGATMTIRPTDNAEAAGGHHAWGKIANQYREYADKSFANYDGTISDKAGRAKDRCKAFVDNDKKLLIVNGPLNSGRTHLAWAAAKDITHRQNKTVAYTPFPKFKKTALEHIDPDWIDADLLIIDDFQQAKPLPDDFCSDVRELLVNRRVNGRKTIIIRSPLTGSDGDDKWETIWGANAAFIRDAAQSIWGETITTG